MQSVEITDGTDECVYSTVALERAPWMPMMRMLDGPRIPVL